MIDSHCHLHDPRMDAVRDAALQRARAAGLEALVLAGVDPPGWAVAAALARDHRDLWPCYGVHPQVVDELEELGEGSDAAAERLVAALAEALSSPARPAWPRPVAVGEIGLDGDGPRRRSLPRQERALRAQLRLAREADLPLVLHVLRAHGPALRVLREEGLPRRGGVVHSYSGSVELLRDYLALGLHISLAGPVTFHNARRQLDIARAVPRERLLVETDAPFQTPEPYRPGPNEPAYLPVVVAQVARLRGESPEEVAYYTARNARALFQGDAAPWTPPAPG